MRDFTIIKEWFRLLSWQVGYVKSGLGCLVGKLVMPQPYKQRGGRIVVGMLEC